jgi:predicted nucleic acid-binding protein
MTSAAPDRRALVDSSASYALIDPREAWHAEALAIRDRLIAERWRLFTTNFLLAETHALLMSRMGRAVAARALFEIDRSATTVIRASAADERRARAIIAQYDDKDFSLTDAISFAVMERLGLIYAFTFDRHFAQYGFIALTPAGA